MIILFTDFGLTGPYTGQMKAVLRREAPQVDIIDLFADAPAFDPRAAAYLLAAYTMEFPRGSVFLCVVDPGVGGTRMPVVVSADGRWFVGPENGLFEIVIRRATGRVRWWHITRRPERLSATFHGRDLFAPAAARLARYGAPEGQEHPIEDIRRHDWPDDLWEIVYVDVFGNAITGVRASSLANDAELVVGRTLIQRAETFSNVSEGHVFWYENSTGLVEIAANRRRASQLLGLRIGSAVASRSSAARDAGARTGSG